MKVTFLTQSAHKLGGTERSAITQANALVAAGHDVRILSVVKAADQPVFAIDDRVVVEHLVDLTVTYDEELHARPSLLVPERWDKQFSALTDVGLERGLRGLATDVLVTVTPALLACALELAPDSVVVVHQEHRSSSQRTSGMEPLLVNAPRADVVALLTPSIAEWLRGQLGAVAPEIVVMPNPLPQGFAPRSLLDSRTIVAAGRLVMEKQYTKLVEAFADVADQLPGWRLRILGQGHQRPHLVRETRKRGLWDRVELPGSTTDMPSEWGRASICALTSRAEAFPLGLQEAMAAGVPCVTFDCASGPREIVRHEVNGLLVAPESIAGMSAALLRLGTDDDLRHRLGAGALESAAEWDADVLAAPVGGDLRGGHRAPGRPAPVRRPLGGALAGAARDAGVRRVGRDARSGPARRARARGRGRQVRDRRVAAWCRRTRRGRRSWCCRWRPGTGSSRSSRRPTRRRTSRCATRLRTAGTSAGPPSPCWPRTCSAGGRRWSRSSPGPWRETTRRCWPRAAPSRWSSGRRASTGSSWRRPATGTRSGSPEASATVTTSVDGLDVPTLPLMAAPTVHECTFPVDVVVTWVDGRDPAWNQARLDRLAGLSGTATTRESSGQARFLSRDELRYSFRSIHLFAPWVRKIHLVTAGQVPRVAGRSRTRRSRWSTIPRSCRRTRCRPSTRTRSSRRCTDCQILPSTSSTSTTTSSSAGRSGRRRSSARPGWPRCGSPPTRSASTRRPTRRRTSRRPGTTAGCSRTPSAPW